MVEFSDFPVEICQMIVERCDILSRFNLRATSKSMLEIVDSSKFCIPTLEVDVKEESIYLRALFWDWKLYQIKKSIEDPNSMEIAAKLMGNILKNAEIEKFAFSNQSAFTGEFLLKLIENLRSSLKVTSIDWTGKEFSNFFDKKSLEEVFICTGDKSDFNGDVLELLKNTGRVLVNFPIDVTDDYVFSMNSTYIRLESETFTGEMINRLVEKFIARGTDSYFEITNEKEDFTGKVGIPEGFVRHPNHPVLLTTTSCTWKSAAFVSVSEFLNSNKEVDAIGAAINRLEF